jgi:hypothetical protein
MNEKIFGNKTALLVLLQLYHHHEAHARGIATDLGVSLSPVQNQLERFEQAGVLISKKMGQTRVYVFNMKSPLTKPFKELVGIIYETLSKEDHQNLFLSTSESPKNDNSCSKCQGIGSLLCCDECSRAYHFSCVGKLESEMDTSEKWRCPECSKAFRASRLHASSTSVGLLDQVRAAEVKSTLDAITVLAGRMN